MKKFPVMMVTAYRDDDRRRHSSELGAAQLLISAVDFDLLKEQLRRLSATEGEQDRSIE
jgi:two-component system, response regulator, stage 0 sporulation protein F